jgi:hypothetical protein
MHSVPRAQSQSPAAWELAKHLGHAERSPMPLKGATPGKIIGSEQRKINSILGINYGPSPAFLSIWRCRQPSVRLGSKRPKRGLIMGLQARPLRRRLDDETIVTKPPEQSPAWRRANAPALERPAPLAPGTGTAVPQSIECLPDAGAPASRQWRGPFRRPAPNRLARA